MTLPSIVFFDMDHTLLDMDCDYSWKVFLADEGLAPGGDRERAAHFLELYHQGVCPVDEFLEFQLREFVDQTEEAMRQIAARHFEQRVRDNIFSQAFCIIEEFKQQGIPTALLTGTNHIIAEPVADALGIQHLLATELQVVDGRFTGKIAGPYLSKQGKVERAETFCRNNSGSIDTAAFYADSINDLQMLERSAQPVTVNPGPKLRSIAESRGWRIENWVK